MSRRWGPRRKSPDAAERGFIEPCLATLKDVPPSEGAWIHEIKYDGYRMMARQAPDGPMLFTRMGFDWTERFGEAIADAIDTLPSTGAYLDGEVVVEDARGISSFAMLQDDLQRGRTDRLVYYAFDLLQVDGKDLRDQPLTRRKAALAKLLKKLPAGGAVRLGGHYDDPDPRKVLAQCCRLGLEGIISKRADRPYRSGRGLDWIKSRCMEQEVFVIGGFEVSKTARGQIAALVVGQRAGRELLYKGHVGTGFSRASSAELLTLLKPLRRKKTPFTEDLEGVTFVEPTLAAEIDYRGWTGDGRVRHASYRGLVEEKKKAPAKPKPAVATAPKLSKAGKLLCQAIRKRRKVELRYDSTDGYGRPDKWRVFHPHALHPKENGLLEVTGRQEVKNRREPTPRNFDLPRILELRLLDETFVPGPPVKADSLKYRHGIICKIGD